MKLFKLYFITFFTLSIYGQDSMEQILVQWTNLDTVSTDFNKQWSYPEGIYINHWGQLSCDGFCPEEMYSLKDEEGKIKEEHIETAYSILDTTHQHHSIKCDVNAYQFGGIHFISDQGIGDTVQLKTVMDAGNHSQLVINLDHSEKFINTHIYFNSVVSNTSPTQFLLKNGWIMADSKKYDQDIFKAIFGFTYINHLKQGEDLYWSGTILTPLK